MAKARKKPSLPPNFDGGTGRCFTVAAANLSSATDAQGRVIAGPRASGELTVRGARGYEQTKLVPIKGDANGRKRRIKTHPIDAMESSGALTSWQAGAARKLLDAWEATMTGAGSDMSDIRVDTTPNPDARTTAMIVKQSRFADLRGCMPRESRRLVEHVVLNGNYLRHGICRNGDEMQDALDRLRIALDCLADYLGLL